MRNLELESEAIRISRFCHIICQILFMHRELSLNKLVFFSYVVKTKGEYLSSLFSAKNAKYLDNKVTSVINGDYTNYCQSIDVILKSIHILILNKNCKLEDGIVFFVSRKGYEKAIYDENSFIYKAINYSKNIEDFQFLKEIVQNV